MKSSSIMGKTKNIRTNSMKQKMQVASKDSTKARLNGRPNSNAGNKIKMGSVADTNSEDQLSYLRLKSKMLGVLNAHPDGKQGTGENKASRSSGSASTKNKDILDKEKLKNLLKVVSDNVLPITSDIKRTQKLHEIYTNSKTQSDSAPSTPQKTVPCHVSKASKKRGRQPNEKNNASQPKAKRFKSTNSDAKGETSVDVNKLKMILSKKTQEHKDEDSFCSRMDMEDDDNVGKNVPSLRERMVERLKAARFRFINEHLYTVPGTAAKEYFSKEPDAFEVYHEGYKNQVRKWPVNPVDLIISDISEKPSNLVVADFGCGEAKLAQSIPNNVHSFDLIALNEYVTACDMSKVPIPKESVDIVVCCLSLMGTNRVDYLKEANRVLKLGGELKIAEIESRILNIKAFNRSLKALGFSLVQQNTDHKMFVFLDYVKKKTCPPNKVVKLDMQPCFYKKR